ncbi:hypothetical protein [Mammaliicoccus sciuri]|uniref:hypothetical protein n=1 Tax=Mammaliicoccus sciuri TaxID=1296 RepID=UPI002B25F9F5|nr:hypothetical protein [Mammaliicoccus sciuri]WQK75130.1 hypothetical protein P3U33_05215 [Mammaliicoccus sciuri]
MKPVFTLIFKNFKSFFSKEENTKMIVGLFIKFFYKIAKEAQENKSNQSKQA